jgi:penicillin amidase
VPTAIADLAAAEAKGHGVVPAAAAEARSAAPADADAGDTAAGSNNWIVGASRSASGSPLVANDPHLALRLPGTWFQVLLRAPDYEVAGMTLPGVPGVVIGRSAHLAWAMTNVMLDDHDLFFEELDPSGNQVRRGATWQPLTSERVTVRVKGQADVPIVLRSTDRGPLLEADAARGLPARSLAWTAYEPADPLAALLALARARRVDEVPAAIAPYACPAQNLLVADREGGLLQTILGRLPRRRAGDGRFPSPGWDPAFGWDGLRPQSDNPIRRAPADDLLWTANHDTWGSERPAYLVSDFDTPHRARRIRELLDDRRDWTPEGLGRIQTDVTSLYARDVVAALAGDYPGEAGEAYRALAAWDGAMAPRGAATLFLLAERELRRAIFADEATVHHLAPFDSRERLLGVLQGRIDPVLFDDATTPSVETRAATIAGALAAAWREGQRRFGADLASWPYAELHALTLAHPLGAVPLLGRWLDRGPLPLPGSATTVEAFGAVWRDDRQAVVYGASMRWVTDLARPDATRAVLPSGQSGHPGDPHYDDQLRLYLDGATRPVVWTPEAIARASVATLRLAP